MKLSARLLLMMLLFLCLGIPSYAQTSSEEYPIFGYYRLGMSWHDFLVQNDKLKKAIGTTYKGVPCYFISIGGYLFDAGSLFDINFCSTIERSTNEKYETKYEPSVFIGKDYFLTDNDAANPTDRLAALTILSFVDFEDYGSVTTYMPIASTDQVNVNKPQKHNHLVNMVDSIGQYLSESRFGKADKEFTIPKVTAKKGSSTNVLNATFMKQFTASGIYIKNRLIPKMVWNKGNMQIILGIDIIGRVSLSFIDTKALSHENLDKIFPKETPKPGISW